MKYGVEVVSPNAAMRSKIGELENSSQSHADMGKLTSTAGIEQGNRGRADS